MNFGEELSVLRIKALLTQEEFAKQIGVATSTVNRWERGKANPNLTAMKAIKQFCTSKNYSFGKIEASWVAATMRSKRRETA